MDGEFLDDVAEEVLKSKDFLKVPVMVGTTNHEFGWILANVSYSDMNYFKSNYCISEAETIVLLINNTLFIINIYY